MTDTAHRQRRPLRLKDYDYAEAGAYYVTVVTQARVCLFGDVIGGEMRLNEAGLLVLRTWNDLPEHYANVSLDAFVVMPNHVHGLIVLGDAAECEERVGLRPTPTVASVPISTHAEARPSKVHALPEIMRAFKSFSARRINKHRNNAGQQVWQRNYYEHVIRNEQKLNEIREYIAFNPQNWECDDENKDRVARGMRGPV